jgi:hypothetical protein
MKHVEDMGLSKAEYPLFYVRFPFDVTGHIMPDGSGFVFFMGNAVVTKIDLLKGSLETITKEIKARKYDHICYITPGKKFTKEEVQNQVVKDVEQDVEYKRLLLPLKAEKTTKEEALKSVRLLNFAINLFDAIGKVKGAQIPFVAGALKFTSDDIRAHPDEEFTDYCDRIRRMTESLFSESEDEISFAPKIKTVPPPPPPPIPPVPNEKGKAGKDTVSVPQGSTGTNINIEIKQPDVKDAEDVNKRKDIDMMRLKKTLYNHSKKIDELSRKLDEFQEKMGTMEQTRQTVLRMNRKVHETETGMKVVEQGNSETQKALIDMRTQQTQENKKMRRYIMERSKKARNQAMILAVTALVVSLITMFLLIPLLMNSWDEISQFFGL